MFGSKQQNQCENVSDISKVAPNKNRRTHLAHRLQTKLAFKIMVRHMTGAVAYDWPSASGFRRGRPKRALGWRRKRRMMGRPRAPPRIGGGAGIRTGGFLGIETKFIDYTLAKTAFSATVAGGELDPTSSVDCISAIAQGDGESNRDGRKCTLISLHIRGNVNISASSGSTAQAPSIMRVIVVWDTQTNGAQLNAEDVMLPAAHVEHSFRNLQFSKRFRILKDQTFTVVPVAGAGDGAVNDFSEVERSFKWNFKFKIPVIHNGTSAVVATITDNSIHIIGFANNVSCNLSYQTRVRFVG